MDIWLDVDTALSEIPVNLFPLIDDTDFKTIEDNSVAYNAAGLELIWHFVTTAGAMTSTPVTPTTGGAYDWTHQDGGIYSIEIPASGGASINNDTEGFGWFTGKATGVLAWRSPIYGFRDAGLNNLLVNNPYSSSSVITQPVAQVASTMVGNDLTVTNRLSFSATYSGLTIPATWTKVYFTVKYKKSDADSASKLQLMETNPSNAADGILYLNGNAATITEKAYGSLTVNQAGGTLTIDLDDNLDFSGMLSRYTYDLKCLLSDGTSQLLASSANITFQATETGTV